MVLAIANDKLCCVTSPCALARPETIRAATTTATAFSVCDMTPPVSGQLYVRSVYTSDPSAQPVRRDLGRLKHQPDEHLPALGPVAAELQSVRDGSRFGLDAGPLERPNASIHMKIAGEQNLAPRHVLQQAGRKQRVFARRAGMVFEHDFIGRDVFEHEKIAHRFRD